MNNETDRAQDYILGRMGDAERERAERDLERDDRFRETVIRLADHVKAKHIAARSGEWASVSTEIAALPQMRAVEMPQPAPEPLVEKGRFRSLRRFGSTRGMAIAVALLVAGSGGFLAGRLERAAYPSPSLAPMLDQESRTVALIEIDSDGKLRILPFAVPAPAEGKELRLWTDGSAGATPLGVVRPEVESRWRLAASSAAAGRRFWATEESAGTTPPKPAGRTVLEGTSVALSR